MGPFASRVLVAVIGLPVVLLFVHEGGWWLFALAAIAAVLALHEYALMIRSLRPVILAAYAGALLSLVGARLGGVSWTMAGLLIGRHKLAPALSPGKTWEGFLFGTAATVFVAFVALYKQDYLSIWESL